MAGGSTLQVQRTTTSTDTVTATQSLALVKNIVRVGLSTVAYLRGLFPESSFESRDYCSIHINQLLPNTPEAKLLIAWLEKGVFDALQRGFLRSIVFGISVPDPSGPKRSSTRLIEQYEWRVGYTDDGVTLNGERVEAASKDQLKAQAIRLIRALIVFTETLDTLNNQDRTLSMMLTYQDHAPADYEPAYFKAAAADGSDRLQMDEGALRVKIGGVVTPHHEIALKFAGLDSTHAAEPSPGPPRRGESLLHATAHPPPAPACGKTPAPTPASPPPAPTPTPTPPQEEESEEAPQQPQRSKEPELTPSKATRLSSLSLEEQKAQQPAAPATVKQERTRKGKAARGGAAAAAEAATESATSAAAVVSTVVGEAEYEAVKAHVLRCFRAGASVPVAATAKALQLPKDKAEAALKRLVREGMLESKPWGAITRYSVRRPAEQKAEAQAPQQEEENKMDVDTGAGAEPQQEPPQQEEQEEEGDGGDGQTVGHHTPTVGANTPPAHLLRGGAGDSDDETVDDRDDASPAAASTGEKRKAAARLASECLLEQGSGFDISLSQNTTAMEGRKCSVICDPIKQVFKKQKRGRK